VTNGQKFDIYQVCELIKCCLKRVCRSVCVCVRERERKGGETDMRPDVYKADFP
jgi:hypothetical protein